MAEEQTTQPAAPQQASAPRASAPPPGQAPRREYTEPREPNTVFIGKKGVMGYVLAVMTQFNNGSPFVKIKARGRTISTAVDVAEIVRHRFLQDAKVREINIATDELLSEDGAKVKVSSIEIVLVK